MEDSELILGEWETNDENKQIKMYSITTKGKVLLKMIGKSQKMLNENSQWKLFMKDFGDY